MYDTVFVDRLFADREKYARAFKRKSYASSMDEFKAANREAFDRIEEDLKSAEDRAAVITEISAAFRAYGQIKLEEPGNRMIKQGRTFDCNMHMVTYIIPAMYELAIPDSERSQLAQSICDAWNEVYISTRISPATRESIQSGFRSKLCYVTTAVCRSLNKPESCEELRILKAYRDNYLAAQDDGEKLIEKYYDIAPTIVKRIDRSEDPHAKYIWIWENYLSKCLEQIKNGQNEQCKETYVDMVLSLKKEYMDTAR